MSRWLAALSFRLPETSAWLSVRLGKPWEVTWESPWEGGKREGRLGINPKEKGLGHGQEAGGNDTIVIGCPS